MRAKFRPRIVRLALIVMPTLITLLAVGGTALIAVAVQGRSIRDTTAERVHEVAMSLASLEEVKHALSDAVDVGTWAKLATRADLAAQTAALQPLADLAENASGVQYAVITDDEGVRITHPDESERGVLVQTTTVSVMAGNEFLGTETGPSGPTLRAKVPVRGDDGTVVGMVAVGIREADISEETTSALGALIPWVIGALVIGTLASSLLTAAAERRARRLEQAAAERDQLRRLTGALREQSHEFTTRLHVIHGLVSVGDSDGALSYIDDVVPVIGGDGESGDSRPTTSLPATVEALRAELAGMGATLDFSLSVDGVVSSAATLVVDEDVLVVLANICRNAGEAGATKVRCAAAVNDGRWTFTVDDNGPGLDAGDAERVFARGYSSKRDRDGLGRGLGLDVVRRTVGERGGSVELGRSEWGGARFVVDMGVAS